MRWFAAKIFLLSVFFVSFNNVLSQNTSTDSSSEALQLHNVINLYHALLAPETGLYNGSEYAYNVYYPFTINEGHPFFLKKRFDTGAVFYNGILYEKVPLMYDIIKEELLTKDPAGVKNIRLNTERIQWF